MITHTYVYVHSSMYRLRHVWSESSGKLFCREFLCVSLYHTTRTCAYMIRVRTFSLVRAHHTWDKNYTVSHINYAFVYSELKKILCIKSCGIFTHVYVYAQCTSDTWHPGIRSGFKTRVTHRSARDACHQKVQESFFEIILCVSHECACITRVMSRGSGFETHDTYTRVCEKLHELTHKLCVRI